MGIFDGLKKCNCAVCGKQITVKAAVERIVGKQYFCKECDDFFNDKCVAANFLPDEKMQELKAELKRMADDLKDTFHPTLNCHYIHIDVENGLFSCGEKYVAGVSPVFSFSDFEMFIGFNADEYKKSGKKWKVNGQYEASFLPKDLSMKELYSLTVPLSDLHKTDLSIFCRRPPQKGETPYVNSKYHYCHFFNVVPQYAKNSVEVIHQYLRNVNDDVYDPLWNWFLKNDSCGEWLFYSDKPYFLDYKTYKDLYLFVNTGFDRKNQQDGREMRACSRLDLAFAYCLAHCLENSDSLSYKRYNRRLQNMYYEKIQDLWKSNIISPQNISVELDVIMATVKKQYEVEKNEENFQTEKAAQKGILSKLFKRK